MTENDKALSDIRNSLLVIVEQLTAIAAAVELLPNRDELLLTELVCAHVRVAGTAIDDRTLYGLYDIVERIKTATRVDTRDIAEAFRMKGE